MYTIGSRAFNSPAVSTYGGAIVDGIPDEFISGGIMPPSQLNTWDDLLKMRVHLGEKKRSIGLAKSEIALQKMINKRIRDAREAGDWGLISAMREAAKEGHWNYRPRKKAFQFRWDATFPGHLAKAKWNAYRQYLNQNDTSRDADINMVMRNSIRKKLETYRRLGEYDKATMEKRPRLIRFNHDAPGLVSTFTEANVPVIAAEPRPSAYDYYDIESEAAKAQLPALPQGRVARWEPAA